MLILSITSWLLAVRLKACRLSSASAGWWVGIDLLCRWWGFEFHYTLKQIERILFHRTSGLRWNFVQTDTLYCLCAVKDAVFTSLETHIDHLIASMLSEIRITDHQKTEVMSSALYYAVSPKDCADLPISADLAKENMRLYQGKWNTHIDHLYITIKPVCSFSGKAH